jgi:atypical dual specificity phosphatase
VIVHCAAGISRSASVVIAYLMEYYNFPLSKALKFVKDTRRIVDPNEGFLQSLAQYEFQLKKEI